MHIPDGYLSPQTAGGLWAFMVPAWYWAGHKVKGTLNARQAPLVAIGAAFTFVIMMFNVPLPGGTTGHAVGGTLVAVVIGPWAAVIAISVALVIQALFFGDGGILALGANCFNMALVLPLTGYFSYRLLSKGAPRGSARRWLGAGIGAYVALNAAALLTALEFGLQGELFRAADGSALYSPYGLSTTIPAMLVPHLLVVGLIEGAVTSLVYVFLMRTNSPLLENYTVVRAAADGGIKLKPLVIGIILLLVFAPLGLLANGTAWGEWGSDEVGHEVGYIPQGMERFSGLWGGLLPDYEFPENDDSAGQTLEASPGTEPESFPDPGSDGVAAAQGPLSLDGAWKSSPAYLISGALGLIVAGGLAMAAVRLLTRGSRKKEQLG
jgi:cobalt/nickel transport system permease protein